MIDIHFGDNLPIIRGFDSGSFDLIYIDPPFNTGQRRERGDNAFDDKFDDYLAFLESRLIEAYRLLKVNGSFFLHLDYREVHYVKVMLDGIFGRESFMNEIIWAYDYGGRSKTRWPAKHDTILWYAKNPDDYTFRYEDMERIPYMNPRRADETKTPTDTWWHSIVPTNGTERTGYPTQKPMGVLKRIIKVHTNPGDHVLDFFAGSGTTGEVAARRGRLVTLVDNNEQAMEVMAKRFYWDRDVRFHGWEQT